MGTQLSLMELTPKPQDTGSLLTLATHLTGAWAQPQTVSQVEEQTCQALIRGTSLRDEGMIKINKINPRVMVWAREMAALSCDIAAQTMGIRPTYLAAIERGDMNPSRDQLARMARSYERPILAFYIQEPPSSDEPLQDFRAKVSARNTEQCQDLEVLLRDLQERHNLIGAALQKDQGRLHVDFVGTACMDAGESALCSLIENQLGLTHQDIRKAQSMAQAFNMVRQRVERLGIHVMLSGHIARYHAILAARIYRSFSIIDSDSPLISINENGEMADWLFALIHELAHLWLGASGVARLSLDDPTEQLLDNYCDDVASEFLLPRSDLQNLELQGHTTLAQRDRILTAAATWHISPKLLAYRIEQAGLIPIEEWRHLDHCLDEWWRTHHRQNNWVAYESLAAKTESDIDRLRLGQGLLNFTKNALLKRQLTPIQAAQVLATKPRNLSHLLSSPSWEAQR